MLLSFRVISGVKSLVFIILARLSFATRAKNSRLQMARKDGLVTNIFRAPYSFYMSGEVKLNTEPADGASGFKSCGKKFSPSMTSDKSEVVHGKLLYGTSIVAGSEMPKSNILRKCDCRFTRSYQLHFKHVTATLKP